jgi:predicted DNA-binding transcriptional regulator AlpA
MQVTTHRINSIQYRIPQRSSLPKIDPEGLYRWAEIAPYLPFKREAWRLRVLNKTAPQPIRLGARCTLWRGADIIDWLSRPDTYTCD